MAKMEMTVVMVMKKVLMMKMKAGHSSGVQMIVMSMLVIM